MPSASGKHSGDVAGRRKLPEVPGIQAGSPSSHPTSSDLCLSKPQDAQNQSSLLVDDYMSKVVIFPVLGCQSVNPTFCW